MKNRTTVVRCPHCHKILVSLTAKQKQVFYYYVIAGMTQEEVGEKMGVSQQMISGHVQVLKNKFPAFFNQKDVFPLKPL